MTMTAKKERDATLGELLLAAKTTLDETRRDDPAYESIRRIWQDAHSAYDRHVSDFVSQHVHACASSMVADALQVFDRFDCWDELQGLASREQDAEQALRDHLANETDADTLLDACRDCNTEEPEHRKEYLDHRDYLQHLRDLIIDEADVFDMWEDFCSRLDVERQTFEAYEHWIISPDLARWLDARGAMVGQPWGDFWLWGRCCSGQSISLDCVIRDIVDWLDLPYEEREAAASEDA